MTKGQKLSLERQIQFKGESEMETKLMDGYSDVKAERPTKVTVTFEVGTGHNQDILNLIERLLTDSSLKISGSDSNLGMIDRPGETMTPYVKPAKPRKVRIYTEADRAAFRARMIVAWAARIVNKAGSEPKVIETVTDAPSTVIIPPVVVAKVAKPEKKDPTPVEVITLPLPKAPVMKVTNNKK